MKSFTIGTLVYGEWNMCFEIRSHGHGKSDGYLEYAIYGYPFNGTYTGNRETAFKRWAELTEEFTKEALLDNGIDFAGN